MANSATVPGGSLLLVKLRQATVWAACPWSVCWALLQQWNGRPAMSR
jgi:hypothetical protein